MATNPVNPDPNLRREPERFPDPDLAPVSKGSPFPWGIVGAILTIIALIAIIWYFK